MQIIHDVSMNNALGSDLHSILCNKSPSLFRCTFSSWRDWQNSEHMFKRSDYHQI